MTKEWLVVKDDKLYHVKLTRGFLDQREVTLNDRRVVEHWPGDNLAHAYEFTTDGMAFRLVIGRGYAVLRQAHDLYVDDERVEEAKK